MLVQVAQVGSKVIHTVVTVLTSQNILLTALLVVTSLQAAVAADGLVTSMVVATAALVAVAMADITALDKMLKDMGLAAVQADTPLP